MDDGKNPDNRVPIQDKPSSGAVQAPSGNTNRKAKAYRIQPPADVLSDPEKLRKWRPEKRTVRQGLAETPTPVLVGYVLLIVVSAIFYVSAYLRLPDLIEVTQFFGMSTGVYNKAVFLVIAFCIQIFLIYRDIIRRSLSKILFLVPLLFFFLAFFIISAL